MIRTLIRRFKYLDVKKFKIKLKRLCFDNKFLFFVILKRWQCELYHESSYFECINSKPYYLYYKIVSYLRLASN